LTVGACVCLWTNVRVCGLVSSSQPFTAQLHVNVTSVFFYRNYRICIYIASPLFTILGSIPQDSRHAAMELELAVETAERLGVSVGIDEKEGSDEKDDSEDDYEDEYEDEPDDDDENEGEEEREEDDERYCVETDGVLLRHSMAHNVEEEPLAAPRLVVIKAGSASAVATILDAIDDVVCLLTSIFINDCEFGLLQEFFVPWKK